MRSQEFTNPGSAGILLYAEDTGRYGLQQRSDSVSDPGVWAAWGGGRKSGESLEQCALRELAEESGYQGPVGLEPLARNSRYVTFIGRVPQEFDPTPNAEVKDHCWVDAGAWPSPMHPGMAAAVKQLGDTVNEANVLRLKDWEVTVSPHALQRTYERGVSAKAVDRILRTLDQIKSNIAGIEPGQPFIIHDQAGTALGMRRLAGNRLTLATVYSTDPDFQRGRYPTFAVSVSTNESQTAKTGIMQTDVYGSRAYHARCLEPGCDWESRRYDRIQQAQAAAKKHAAQHFAARPDVAEVIDPNNPWGPQGNFAGATPVDVGGVSMKNIEVGDTVKYFGQTAKILAMSNNRKYSRINIPSDFGGTTKDVLTSDLKLLGQGMAENFADGRNPGRKGLAKRMGVNCKQPVSKLRSIAKNSSGERQRMAHWCANMKSGKKK
jgi:hypothetical protein